MTLKMEVLEFCRIEANLLTKVRAHYFDYIRNKKASFTNLVSKEFANVTANDVEEWFPEDRDDILTTVKKIISLFSIMV